MGALVGAIDSSAGNSSSSWTAKSADADLEGGPLLEAIALLGVNSPSLCLPTPRSRCRITTPTMNRTCARHVSETIYLEHGKLKRLGHDCPSEHKNARWNHTNSTCTQCEIVSILLLGGKESGVASQFSSAARSSMAFHRAIFRGEYTAPGFKSRCWHKIVWSRQTR